MRLPTPRIIPRVLLLAGIALAAAPALAANVPGDVAFPPVQRTTLANGIELLLVEKHDIPLVSIDIVLRGGAQVDPVGKEGTAVLLAELLQKGAGERDARQFAEAIDGSGGALWAYATQESFGLVGTFLAEDLALAIELSADALLRPHLDHDEFERVRTRSIQALVAAKGDSPGDLIAQYGYATLFAGHPYGRPEGGDESSLAAISLADIERHHADQIGGDRMAIAIVGDIDADSVRARLQSAFGGMGVASGRLPEVLPAPVCTGREVLLIDKPGLTQTHFWIGNVGVARADAADAAQTLANTVFGGRFTSMLNTELRITSGLSYGASSSLDRLLTPGATVIGSYARTDATGQAIDLALATLDRLHSDGVPAAMLESARNYVLGQVPSTLETNSQIADSLTGLWLYRLPVADVEGFAERVGAVDAMAMKTAIADAYPTSDNVVMVLIGDAARIREGIGKYGPVHEMKISEPRFSPRAPFCGRAADPR